MVDTCVTEAGTFTCPREVHIYDWRIATVVWILRLGVFFYVIYEMRFMYTYFDNVLPSGTMDGWLSHGTMYTGTDQAWTAENGSVYPVNVADPHYCNGNYTKDYYYSAAFAYSNISCVKHDFRSIWKKQTPTYQFLTTFYQETEHEAARCSDLSPTCNASSSGVTQVGDSCECQTFRNYYVINPEGATLNLNFNVEVEHGAGTHTHTYRGQNTGTTSMIDSKDDLKVTTFVKDLDDNVKYTFEPGMVLNFTMVQLLELAGTSLDELAPASTSAMSADDVQSLNCTDCLTRPYNRLVGALLYVDMEFVNYDVRKLPSATGETIDGLSKFPGFKNLWGGLGAHDMACIMRVRRKGDWTSYGSEVTDVIESGQYKPSAGDYGSNDKIDIFTTKTVTRWHQGIKVVFHLHGKIGFFEMFYFMEVIVQAVVLMGVSTYVGKYWAIYGLMGLGMFIPYFADGTDEIFKRYQDTEVAPRKVIARTAANSALQVKAFLNHLDQGIEKKGKKFTGNLSKVTLFRILQILYGGGLLQHLHAQRSGLDPDEMTATEMRDHHLSEEQIAQVVWDISEMSQLDDPEDDLDFDVDLEEFIHFIMDDSADLLSVIRKYSTMKPDAEVMQFYRSLQNDMDNMDMTDTMKALKDLHDQDRSRSGSGRNTHRSCSGSGIRTGSDTTIEDMNATLGGISVEVQGVKKGAIKDHVLRQSSDRSKAPMASEDGLAEEPDEGEDKEGRA